MKLLAGLLAAWAGVLTWLGLDHPYGLRFAMGLWPVPQGTPWSYQLESGFVPALTVLSLLGTLVSLYHLKNCHHDGCWRLGKQHVNGLPWCAEHAAEVKPERSAEDLLKSIEAALTRIAADSKTANDASATLNQQLLTQLEALAHPMMTITGPPPGGEE